MAYPDGSPHTAHSKAPVPCVLWGENIHKDKITVMKETAALKDVAPTIVHLLGLEKPAEFTGNSIFI
jgi:2,3-bisphosphoglycerate-independent phosphoglycerate mutase